MITEKQVASAWHVDQEEVLRKQEGRAVLFTVVVLSLIVGVSFYALSRQNGDPPKDLPKTERQTGPAASRP